MTDADRVRAAADTIAPGIAEAAQDVLAEMFDGSQGEDWETAAREVIGLLQGAVLILREARQEMLDLASEAEEREE
jgi:hypothetical protein